MAKHISNYPGRLILPDGQVMVRGGEPVDIPDDMAKNVAVAEWIKNEWLAPVKAETTKAPAKK